MLEVLMFIFEDFWRFLGVCVLMMIAVLWKPLEINLVHEHVTEEGKKDADE